MEETKKKLYIPTGVKSNNFIIDGVGKAELMKIIITFLTLCIFIYIQYLIAGNILFSFVLIFVAGAGSYYFYRKESELNQSMYDMIMMMIKYSKSQKIFYYIKLDEWR